jgi:hypothetical protein
MHRRQVSANGKARKGEKRKPRAEPKGAPHIVCLSVQDAHYDWLFIKGKSCNDRNQA